jgi:prepilin-type N-terminal cleavage/methylation domain-containing protein
MKRRWLEHFFLIPCHSSSHNKGFTLFELLIVVAILSILCAIAIPSFVNLVDETRINLLTEQVRQSLKEAQRQAILDRSYYKVTFRKTEQGLQVSYSPTDSTPVNSGNIPHSNDTPFSVPPEPQTWRKLTSSIPPNQLIFTIPDSPNNTIIFTPQGDIEFSSKVFMAMGNLQEPRVNTRRCVSIINSDSGGSYFQIDKDLACDANPNGAPFMLPGVMK